jgi:glycosyltransferase involved in cell wall biosynthesis
VNGPLVTVGVPVYRGQDDLPVTLECLRTQSYQNLDVLISVDANDLESARACEPFLRSDSRFRIEVQPSRLGWAGNTDWTMRHRRGEFYIFQQHDDQISPTYVADLVDAAARFPDASVCFAAIHVSGLRTFVQPGVALSGSPVERAKTYLEHLDHVPFRGLIRSSALASTSGLLLADFNPFDSFGTEIRLMTELALLGEFRFVPGPIYYKRIHGENIHLTRNKWSEQQKLMAWACLAGWMIEVIVPAGQSVAERRDLLDVLLDRFLMRHDRVRLLRILARRVVQSHSSILAPLRAVLQRLKKNEAVVKATTGRYMVYEADNRERRAALLRTIFDRLKSEGRFDPLASLQSSWEATEAEAFSRFSAHA